MTLSHDSPFSSRHSTISFLQVVSIFPLYFVISDGNIHNTRVLNPETGEQINNITGFRITSKATDRKLFVEMTHGDDQIILSEAELDIVAYGVSESAE